MTDQHVDIAAAGVAAILVGLMWAGAGWVTADPALVRVGAALVTGGVIVAAADPSGFDDPTDQDER